MEFRRVLFRSQLSNSSKVSKSKASNKDFEPRREGELCSGLRVHCNEKRASFSKPRFPRDRSMRVQSVRRIVINQPILPLEQLLERHQESLKKVLVPSEPFQNQIELGGEDVEGGLVPEKKIGAGDFFLNRTLGGDALVNLVD